MDKLNLKTLSVKKSLVSKVSNEREAQKARLKNSRDQKRATNFFATRGLDVEEDNARKTRAQKLEEFRKEKMKKKLEEQKKKLPPFRAGIVRHAMNSPYKFELKDKAPPTNTSNKAPHPPIKTFNFTMKPKIKPCLKMTIPQSPKFSSLARHRHCVDSALAQPVIHLPPGGVQNGMVKERNGILTKNKTRQEINKIMNKNETKRKEKDDKVNKNERRMEKENEVDMSNSIEIPEFFVKGCVAGPSKQNLRKSSLLTPIKAPVATTPTKLTGVEYQRHRIHEERNLLHKYCYRWYDILNDSNQNIPSDIRDEIDCIIGQTKLLTSDKFQQMSNLVDQFENQSRSEGASGTLPSAASGGEPCILENDLDSFWDMIYIQVDLMYKKFDRLKQLESDNWIDKEEEEAKKLAATKKTAAATRKTAVKSTGNAKAAAARGKSRLADFIRNKRAQAAQSGDTILNGEQEEDKKSEMETDQTKLFTGIFFKIESPVSKKRSKASPKFTPHVQKSILKNKMSAINMIAVSPLAKSLATTSLVDVISTPSDEMKSILKKKTGNTAGTKPKPFTPGGKKICFSLNEPTTDDEVFSTPRETPQKRIRKTPYKPQQTFSPGQEFSPDLEDDQTQDDQDMMDIETQQNDEDDPIDDTFSVTICEPTTSGLENDSSLPQRILRSTQSSSRRDNLELSSVLQSISLNTSRNNDPKQKSRNSNVHRQKSPVRRKSSRKSGKITFEENSSSENEASMESKTCKVKNSSSKKQLEIEFESTHIEQPEKSYGQKSPGRKSLRKSVKITFEDSSSDGESTNIESKMQSEENLLPKKQVLRVQQNLSVPADSRQSSPIPDSPQQFAAFQPRRSPRVSRQPVRFSAGDRNNNTPLQSKKLSNKCKTKNRMENESNKTRIGSESSKENRTPKVSTPQKSSNTPSKGSAKKTSSSSRSDKKFVLRPSRLAV